MGVLVKLISELNSTLGVTCIVVSHDVPGVLSIADYAYIVADKRLSPTVAPSRYGRIPILGFVSSLMVLPTVRYRSVIPLATITMIY